MVHARPADRINGLTWRIDDLDGESLGRTDFYTAVQLVADTLEARGDKKVAALLGEDRSIIVKFQAKVDPDSAPWP